MKKIQFFGNNQLRTHCKTHIIVFPKTNLKKIKTNIIKSVFLKMQKNENSKVLEKFSSYLSTVFSSEDMIFIEFLFNIGSIGLECDKNIYFLYCAN